MSHLKLYMLLLGGRPPGRHTEQHDIFFAIGDGLKSIVPLILAAWPEAKKNLHVDAWREVTAVDGYSIAVKDRKSAKRPADQQKKEQLFFINLGGYRSGTFDELHYKMITVQPAKADAVKHARRTPFYRQETLPGAHSHIDDHHGIDIDDLYKVTDLLPALQKEQYSISITRKDAAPEDKMHLGYFKLSGFK